MQRVLGLETEVARLRSELAEARRALAETQRQYRRELVPLQQAVSVFETRLGKK